MSVWEEKRGALRIPVSERGVLQDAATNKEIPVMIMDVSSKGVGILSETLFPQDQNWVLKYSILHREFSFPVFILWTMSNNDGYYGGCIKEIPQQPQQLFA
jgi:hypothetical protein